MANSSYPILKDDSSEYDQTYDLPDGWSKRIIQRRDGASKGNWDAYLIPPRQYNHRRLRSVIELGNFLIKYPHCEINCRHVNMEKLPEVVMGPEERLSSMTKKLMSFVDSLKKGENVTVEGHFNPHKSKKVLQQKAVGSDENKQSKVKRKSTKKVTQEVPVEVKPVLPQFSLDQTLKLEKLFHASCRVPTPEEMDVWSSGLRADYNDIHDWFRIKWRARLEYELSIAKQTEAGENYLTLSRPRPLQRFDVPVLFDPLIQNDVGNHFDIGNEDGEEDVVNIATEVAENTGDIIVDEEGEDLGYSEITIEEHWPTIEDEFEESSGSLSYSLPG